MDTKKLRKLFHSSESYYRTGFGQEEKAKNFLESEYQSSLIQQICKNNFTLQQGEVTILLAEAFSFCWGVERAVIMAYETRQHFPDKRIWITNEIIHNPLVNQNLRDIQVNFIPFKDNQKDLSVIAKEDVVILPAFGASVQELEFFYNQGCTIIDTTCPWISKVWNTVEKHKKDNFTSIIHGKYNHDETINTSSFANKYLIVLNLAEAEYVCNYILHGGNHDEFMTKFSKACSFDFNPDTDLEQIGIANQTTMLKTETEQIGKLFERTMMRKYGPLKLNKHFISFNTICEATQERQDAMFKLVDKKPDLIIVIGGFNSSNTTHLHEIALNRGIPSYHIDTAERISLDNCIEHKLLHQDLTVTENWLPEGSIVVGITAGASTPSKIVEDTIKKIFQLKSINSSVEYLCSLTDFG